MKNEEINLANPKGDSIKIPPEISVILNDPKVTQERKKEIVSFLTAKQQLSIHEASTFSGPIPPPEILKEYDKLIPNGADRILRMAENQSNHRMQLETHVVREELKQSGRGQFIGGIISIFGLSISGILGMAGHEVLAGTIATTTILSLVTTFVIGKKAQQKDLESKR